MEGVVKNAEHDKADALNTQKQLHCEIGGRDFRHLIGQYELQQAKDKREIAFLEAHHMHERSLYAGRESIHRSRQSLPVIPQDLETSTTQTRVKSLPQPPIYSTESRGFPALTNSSFPVSEAPEEFTRFRSSTMTNPRQNLLEPRVTQLPRSQVSTRQRSSTLNPSAHDFTPSPTSGPRRFIRDIHDTTPFSSVTGLRSDVEQKSRPTYCHHCGTIFTVEEFDEFQSHRMNCPANDDKNLNTATMYPADTSSPKVVDFARSRRNTMSNDLSASNAVVSNSMPNLHAPLSFRARQSVNHGSPMTYSRFQNPYQKGSNKHG